MTALIKTGSVLDLRCEECYKKFEFTYRRGIVPSYCSKACGQVVYLRRRYLKRQAGYTTANGSLSVAQEQEIARRRWAGGETVADLARELSYSYRHIERICLGWKPAFQPEIKRARDTRRGKDCVRPGCRHRIAPADLFRSPNKKYCSLACRVDYKNQCAREAHAREREVRGDSHPRYLNPQQLWEIYRDHLRGDPYRVLGREHGISHSRVIYAFHWVERTLAKPVKEQSHFERRVSIIAAKFTRALRALLQCPGA